MFGVKLPHTVIQSFIDSEVRNRTRVRVQAEPANLEHHPWVMKKWMLLKWNQIMIEIYLIARLKVLIFSDFSGNFEEVLAMDQVKQAEKKIILSGIFSVQALEVRSKYSEHPVSSLKWSFYLQEHFLRGIDLSDADIFIYVYIYSMLRNCNCCITSADRLLQWIAPHQ